MLQAESDNTRIPSRRDVITGGGKVAAGAAVTAMALAPFASASSANSSNDEQIIALGEEHALRLKNIENGGLPDDLVDALTNDILAIEDRIAALPASTFAAIAVKLRVTAVIFDCPDNLTLSSAIADCERLAKGV